MTSAILTDLVISKTSERGGVRRDHVYETGGQMGGQAANNFKATHTCNALCSYAQGKVSPR